MFCLDSTTLDPPTSKSPGSRKHNLNPSTNFMMTQEWELHPETYPDAMVTPTKRRVLHGWTDCIDKFIHIINHNNKVPIEPITANVGPVKLVQENAVSDTIDMQWLLNTLIEIDIHWIQYVVEYLYFGDQQDVRLLNCTIQYRYDNSDFWREWLKVWSTL
jgi:hypothetical protein